ncbi:hypothetical protein M2165_004228 [Variovorax sp. TBS-050B]|uniref:hypothetical protein n=1 Tax=Variovorax sp. TBS-050B TaxID=2940551 RepID=UPI002474654F|nr:hypothetical protein [Variovorax sp. TBS-050B]MDH6594339.1 hypothetical protein [Variovorax sp. TBS-050B]
MKEDARGRVLLAVVLHEGRFGTALCGPQAGKLAPHAAGPRAARPQFITKTHHDKSLCRYLFFRGCMGYLNPLLKLPAVDDLIAKGRALSPGEREFLIDLFTQIRHQANREAESSWKRRKGPLALYWRWASTYARHIAHLVKQLNC